MLVLVLLWEAASVLLVSDEPEIMMRDLFAGLAESRTRGNKTQRNTEKTTSHL